MSDQVADVARAVAQRMESEVGSGLSAEVEAALYSRQSPPASTHYADPIALAGLIVSIADLAWTVYTDLKKRATGPAAEVLARTVRIKLRESSQVTVPDHIVDVIVTETVRIGADHHVEAVDTVRQPMERDSGQ